jgi:hypothetical protein
MFNNTTGIVKYLISILLFPALFQTAFIKFSWGASDPGWIMFGKRFFLLLPTLSIILGCWITVACLLSLVVRHNRQQFIISLIITWWDLGKSILSFWGGIIKFLFNLSVSLLGAARISLVGVGSLLLEILFLPFRLTRSLAKNVASSSVPWIAVFLTIFWCIIESIIFTYVTTPIVMDTFSNITGEQLSLNFIRLPLFIFLLFIVLGSYAVLSTMVAAVKNKNITAIIGIGVIETVALFVEVIFLYREFVDSLVPWFAQYSENFELGVFWTLAISVFVWFGIRSLSWFLFAAHGTPTIMLIIQGKGIKLAKQIEKPESEFLKLSNEFFKRIKEDSLWFQKQGEDLMNASMLPPLQVIAASINFCTLLITSTHMFKLPFKSMEAISNSKVSVDNILMSKQSLKDA